MDHLIIIIVLEQVRTIWFSEVALAVNGFVIEQGLSEAFMFAFKIFTTQIAIIFSNYSWSISGNFLNNFDSWFCCDVNAISFGFFKNGFPLEIWECEATKFYGTLICI